MKIRMIVIICLACLISLATYTQAGSIKLALDSPPDLEKSGTYVWASTFAKHLESNGIKVKQYPNNALGGEDEKLDQVSQGLLEVSCSDLAKAGQLDPTILGFTLPFMFDSMAHLDRVMANTDLMERVNKGTTRKGVRVLALIPVGAFSGLSNTQHPVKTPADVKGLRIRAMDKTQAEYISAWGASTVIVPWGEIYNSLQTGVADGYLNPAVVSVMFKHTEVLKHFSDIKLSAPIRVSICSEDWYMGLSKKQRAIVDSAVVKANEANRVWQAGMEKMGAAALDKAGVKLYQNTPEEIAQFAELSRPTYTKIVSSEIADIFVQAAKANR